MAGIPIYEQKLNVLLSGAEPLDMAVLLLPDLPLVPEPDGRAAAVRRPQLLRGLVELEQHRGVLALVEPTRAPLGRQTRLHTRHGARLREGRRKPLCLYYIGALSRVLGE